MTIKREINGQTVEIELSEEELEQATNERMHHFVEHEIAYWLDDNEVEEDFNNNDIIDLADDFIYWTSDEFNDPILSKLDNWLESRFC